MRAARVGRKKAFLAAMLGATLGAAPALFGECAHQRTPQRVVHFVYDAVGNQVRRLDELNNTTYLSYDLLNRLFESKDAAFAVTYMGYDARGSVVKRVDADGRSTYYVYDGARRLTGQTFKNPVFGETTDNPINNLYDLVGNLVTVADDTITQANYFEYDRLDRLTKKFTLAGATYMAYDKGGLRTSFKDPDLKENVYVYDSNGRLQKEQLDAARTAYWTYDKAGLVKTKTSPSSSSTPRIASYYSYDAAARLFQLENRLGSDFSLVTYFAYVRDANGQITQMVHEGGDYTYYNYDALDRVTLDERFNSSNAKLYGYLYNYDAASNRYFVFDEIRTQQQYFTFDNRNLLTKEFTYFQTDGTINTNYFVYDSSQRMTKEWNLGSGPGFTAQATYFTHNQRNMLSQLDFQKASGGADTQRQIKYTGTGERVVVSENGNTSPHYWSYDGKKLVLEKSETGSLVKRYRHNAMPGPCCPPASLLEIEHANQIEFGMGYPALDHRGSITKLAYSTTSVDTWLTNLFGIKQTGADNFQERMKFLSTVLASLSTTTPTFLAGLNALYMPAEAFLTAGGAVLGLAGIGLAGGFGCIPPMPGPPMVPRPPTDPTVFESPLDCFVAGVQVIRQKDSMDANTRKLWHVGFQIVVFGLNLSFCELRQDLKWDIAKKGLTPEQVRDQWKPEEKAGFHIPGTPIKIAAGTPSYHDGVNTGTWAHDFGWLPLHGFGAFAVQDDYHGDTAYDKRGEGKTVVDTAEKRLQWVRIRSQLTGAMKWNHFWGFSWTNAPAPKFGSVTDPGDKPPKGERSFQGSVDGLDPF